MVVVDSSGDALDLTRIAAAVRPLVTNVITFAALDSTHACALRLMAQADEEEVELHPTVILAGRQLHGVGRGGRHWVSPPGGLYLSWVRADLDGPRVARLPMVAAAAAHAAVTATGVRDLGIKWPNDLIVGGRKLAGILVQARHGEHTIATVGLGVNLRTVPRLDDRPLHPPVAATAVLEGADPQTLAESIATDFVAGLERGLAQPATAVETWRQALIHRPGDPVTVRTATGEEHRGRFLGVTDDGFLRLETDGGEFVASGGDVVE